MPVATVRMLGSKMMSCGRKADLLRQDAVGAFADLDAALEGVRLALFVEGHHDHGGAVAADQAGLVLRTSPRLP